MESCRICAHSLQQAIALYRGDFLHGIYVSGSISFENWLILNRERQQQQALEALNHLTRFHARRGEFAAARRYAWRQVEIAPWLETAYRQLMALFALTGQRGAALSQFEMCRQRLDEELGVPPGPKTMALYEQIKAGRRPLNISSLPIMPPPPRRIPAQTTAFLGRKRELLAVAEHLQKPECRLLTLLGAGGSGKTRLAIQTAVEEFTNFEQGVFFVPLADVEDAENLSAALAEGIGLSLGGKKSPQEQVLNYLREKEILLVLDNFEGLLGNGRHAATDFLTDILKTAPNVTLLITSRQPVGLRAERLYDLDGLSYPDDDDQTDIEQYEAVQLFLDRARRVRPRFKTNPETMAAIASICRLAEGLPLGIELAAAWVRTMDCAEILQGMRRNLDMLATAYRDVPARHRSLRATFAYSWAMLLPEEQRAFSELSVFRGGFRGEAALADQQTLLALVEKSLLRREADGRYQIHELLRQFGAEKLSQDPIAEEAARNHHCAWTAKFLQTWEPHLKGGRQVEALSQIRSEIENARAGWRYAAAQRKETIIAQSAPALTLFYDTRGWFQEGLEMFSQAAAMVEEGVLYGRLLAYQAAFSYRLGQFEPAQKLFEQSLSLFRRLNAVPETAYTLNGLASIAINRGEYTAARQLAAESLPIAQESGNAAEEAKSLDMLGIAARYEGRLAEAEPYFQDSLKLYERLGNQFGMARCYNYLGNAAVAKMAYEEAAAMFSRAKEICRTIDYRFMMPYLLSNLGIVAAHMQKYEESKAYFREGFVLFQDLGDQFGQGMVQNNLGEICLLMGDDEEAWNYFRAGVQAGEAMQSQAIMMGALTGIAALLSRKGQKVEALALATLVLRHPAARSETKGDAERLANELKGALSLVEVEAAGLRGDGMSLEEATAVFLDGS